MFCTADNILYLILLRSRAFAVALNGSITAGFYCLPALGVIVP